MSLPKLFLFGAVVTIGACTYNEYQNTYNQVAAPDAGAPVAQAGRGGSSGSGPGGSGGSNLGGSGGAGNAAYCAGCLMLSMPANPGRALGLAFQDDEDLSQTRLTWRMRVMDFTGQVQITLFAESGSSAEERLFLSQFSLAVPDGWQEFGVEFAEVQPFRAPSFVDAGEGAGGSGFDDGFLFDKSEVERIALTLSTSLQVGVFTPLVIEIDSVRFSDRSDLDRDFAANDGGVELINLSGEPTEGADLLHVLE
jgi:hypothetical protein